MGTFIGGCDSASSGEVELLQRCRGYAIRTGMSAVAEAGISMPRLTRLGVAAPSLCELPTEIERYFNAV
jgi:hypothetical protein